VNVPQLARHSSAGKEPNNMHTHSEGMILLTPALTAASMRCLCIEMADEATAETKASCPSSAAARDSGLV
jgi:hypothetical protein